MQKSEVYSWRLSPDPKHRLSLAARTHRVSLARRENLQTILSVDDDFLAYRIEGRRQFLVYPSRQRTALSTADGPLDSGRPSRQRRPSRRRTAPGLAEAHRMAERRPR